MDADDLEPRKKRQPLKNLDEMSIEALHDYIGELEAEIRRARTAIEAKTKARSGAQAFFKA